MRGETDRECRARGGRAVSYNAQGSVPSKIFKGNKHSPNTPDASLKRGAGPLFRKRGGRLPEAFKEHEGDPEEGREDKATGGAISGGSSKPSMGRAGRKLGGRAGHADLRPTTYPETPSMPKGTKLMGESEKVP
jgi:hypothetical protein